MGPPPRQDVIPQGLEVHALEGFWAHGLWCSIVVRAPRTSRRICEPSRRPRRQVILFEAVTRHRTLLWSTWRGFDQEKVSLDAWTRRSPCPGRGRRTILIRDGRASYEDEMDMPVATKPEMRGFSDTYRVGCVLAEGEGRSVVDIHASKPHAQQLSMFSRAPSAGKTRCWLPSIQASGTACDPMPLIARDWRSPEPAGLLRSTASSISPSGGIPESGGRDREQGRRRGWSPETVRCVLLGRLAEKAETGYPWYHGRSVLGLCVSVGRPSASNDRLIRGHFCFGVGSDVTTVGARWFSALVFNATAAPRRRLIQAVKTALGHAR